MRSAPLQDLMGSSPDDADILDTPAVSLLVTCSALVAGVATRRLLQACWTSWRGEAPPNNPGANDATWSDALIWAVAVGATVGVARVLGRRGMTAAMRKHYG